MSIENVPWAKVETLMVSPNTRIVARLHVEWIGMAKARVAPALQPITESKVKIKKKKRVKGGQVSHASTWDTQTLGSTIPFKLTGH